MNKALLVNILRTVKKSFSRFISIIIIIMLGAGFFAGFKSASPDMRVTADNYFKTNNLFDLRLQSTLGLTNSDLRAISQLEGVDYLMPSKFVDALVRVNGEPETDIDGSRISARAYGLDFEEFAKFHLNRNENGSFMNRPTLIEGNVPTQLDQCLVDRSKLSTPESYKIGNTITLEGDSDSNNIYATLGYTEFKIVGIVESPYYLSFERGNTLVGSGKVGTYIYISDQSFVTDYFTEVFVNVKGSQQYDAFSQEYTDTIKPVKEKIEAIAPERLTVRANFLNSTLPQEIVSGQAELASKRQEANKALADAKNKLDMLEKLSNDGIVLYNQKLQEFNDNYAQVKDLLSSNQAGLQEKVIEYQNNSKLYNSSLAKYTAEKGNYDIQREDFNKKEREFTSLGNQLSSGRASVNSLLTIIQTTETTLSTLEQNQNAQLSDPNIANILSVIRTTMPEVMTAIDNLSAQGIAFEAIKLIKPELTSRREELRRQQEELDVYQEQYNEAEINIKNFRELLDNAKVTLDKTYDQLMTFKSSMEAAHELITNANSQLESKETELMFQKLQAQNELNILRQQIDDAPMMLEKGRIEYEEAEKEANKQVFVAQTKLENADKLLHHITDAVWNVYEREDTPGYTSYTDAMNTVRLVSNIFPAFFFLLATLMCFTTITRLVKDERTQIGTMMALGYSSQKIASKYVIYALIASLIGCVIGIAAGIYGIPLIIIQAYNIMFELPPLIITFPWQYIVLGVVLSIASAILAALLACRKDLKTNPAVIMRPDAPKAGKKVFVERIGFFWSRLNYSSKVTMRNVFRNPRRFIMTIFGMAGCTALLLAAVAFYNSVGDIMSLQYGNEGIAMYDVQFVFANPQTTEGQPEIMTKIKKDSRISSVMLMSMQSFDGSSERTDRSHDVYVSVPHEPERLNEYIKLQNRKTKEKLILDDNTIVITEKFANDTKSSVGDTIYIVNADGRRFDITVGGIVENYTFSYIYMTSNAYTGVFGEEPSFSYAIANLTDLLRAQGENSTEKSKMATDMMKDPTINAVAFSTDTVKTFSEIVKTILSIIALFISAAIFLALAVLYNLSNMTITERTRELATLKVIGLYDKEVVRFIYKENIISTLISIIFGLFMGVGLHKLLITYAAVDTVMYGQSIGWENYAIAAALSVFFSLLISMPMRSKVKKIEMVESFKSVE